VSGSRQPTAVHSREGAARPLASAMADTEFLRAATKEVPPLKLLFMGTLPAPAATLDLFRKRCSALSQARMQPQDMPKVSEAGAGSCAGRDWANGGRKLQRCRREKNGGGGMIFDRLAAMLPVSYPAQQC